MNKLQANNLIDKFAYFPFIGWFVLLILGRDDEFSLHHIKQAFIMALVFAAALIILGTVLTFTRRGEGYLRLVFVILIYLVYLLYFAMCVIGTRAVLRSEKISFPVISKYASKVNI